jgi:CheY-like chemotaxis protein
MARILVIEDDELVRATITTMLEDGGHSVAVPVDGNDGLLQFRRAPFDLVISDVFMPNKNGIEMLRELRQIDGDVPVISKRCLQALFTSGRPPLSDRRTAAAGRHRHVHD